MHMSNTPCLQESTHKLVICEKPSVARALAQALGCTKNRKTHIEGNGCVITWCLGHLVEPAQAAAYDTQYIKWSCEALPILPEEWQYTVRPAVREQFTVVKKLMKISGLSEVICATDAGREGELIFRLVYEKAGCRLPVKRLWLSSMEESAIKEGFANLRDGKDFDNLYQSALARQKADWLVGINFTRLFSVLYGSKVYKVGRVQSPTLAMIVRREQEIRDFRKKPFYTVLLETSGLQAVSERMEYREKAEQLAADCNLSAVKVLKISREDKNIPAPKPFDLTSLQQEANRLFGFSAKQTLEYTQSLYEQKLCTYPRTDSRYLSDDMDETAGKVLEAIALTMPFAANTDPYAANLKAILDTGKVTDHHAIIPTERITTTNLEDLTSGERKILHLIAAGLYCSTMKPAKETILKAELECAGANFTATHTIRPEPGWKAIYAAMKHQLQDASQNAGKPTALTNALSTPVNSADAVSVNASSPTSASTNTSSHNADPTNAGLVSATSDQEALGNEGAERGTSACESMDREASDQEASAPAGTFYNLVEGMHLTVCAKVTEGFTKPPKRYTEATLLSAMEQAGAKETDNVTGIPAKALRSGFCGEKEGQQNEADARRKEGKAEWSLPRRGLGTPATRADIIEKLITDKYVRREKKTLIPTDAGTELVTILPETLRSPQLTADWENALLKISHGEMNSNTFLTDIENMVKDLTERYRELKMEKNPTIPPTKAFR